MYTFKTYILGMILTPLPNWPNLLITSLNTQALLILNQPFIDTEIEVVCKELLPWKTPGPDDLPYRFYHHYWDLVKMEVIPIIHELYKGKADISLYNLAILVLIPKSKNPQKPFNWRPISLSNAIYKILSKIICKRLKLILPNILPLT